MLTLLNYTTKFCFNGFNDNDVIILISNMINYGVWIYLWTWLNKFFGRTWSCPIYSYDALDTAPFLWNAWFSSLILLFLCVSLRAHFCIKSGRMLVVLVSQLWKSLHYFRRRYQICKLACILLSFKLLCYFWLTWVQQLWCFSNDKFRQKFLTSFIKGPDLHYYQ